MVKTIKGDKVRLEQSFMGNFVTVIRKGDSSIRLINAQGVKSAEIKVLDKNESSKKVLKIEFTAKEKRIAGYNCNNAIVFYEDGDENEVWYTKEIKGLSNSNWARIDGFLMEYTEYSGDLVFISKVTNIKQSKIEDSFFEIPADYPIKTFDKLKDELLNE